MPTPEEWQALADALDEYDTLAALPRLDN